MMKPLLICALLAPVAAAAQDAPLSFYTETYTPYSYMEGDTLTGHAVDFVTEGLSRAELTASMELTKWTRAISLAEKQDNSCVFTTARTEEREPKFQWVGPMYTNAEYLIQRPGTNAEVTSLEGALTKTIGTQTGDYTEAMLRKMGATDLDLAADQNMTLKKLEAGRIDYVIIWGGAAKAAAASGKFEIAFEASRTDFYLACGLGTDPKVVEALNESFASIVADGTRDKLMAAYD